MALTQVKTSGLADDSVTLAKQAAGTDGNIISYDASGNPVAIATGNDGQVLTSTGAGSPPAFEDLPASGVTVSNNSNNRVVTGDGSNLNAEANLSFDGSVLDCTGKLRVDISTTGTAGAGTAEGIFLRNTNETDDNAVTIFAGADDYSAAASAINFINRDHSANSGDISFDTRSNGNTYAERLRITKDGRILQGHTASIATWGAGLNRQTHGTDTDSASQSLIRWSNNASGPSIHFAKSRGGIGTQTIVQDNDNIGGFAFLASDGNDFNNDVARIDCNIDGSPANNVVPGEIVFTTTKSTGQAYNNMKIRNDGNVEISNGNVVIGTAGKGIDFSAQTASSATGASTTAEILNHYEYGTWTPVIYGSSGTGGVNHANQSGQYVRVGNLVNLWYYVNWSGGSHTFSGYLQMSGFPFSVQSGNNMQLTGSLMMHNVDLDGNAVNMVFHTWHGGSYGQFYATVDDGGWSPTGWDDAGKIIGHVSYMT